MEKDNDRTILIFSDPQPSLKPEGLMTLDRRSSNPIKADVLQKNVTEFLESMDTVVSNSPKTVGNYSIDSIQINAEISGEGQIGIAGTGIKVGGTIGITFNLAKPKK
jgi:TPP-dependent 2-oxoacid decarboxylase